MATMDNSQNSVWRQAGIKELLARGVERIIEEKSLLKKLKSGRKLRVKLGIDPTGPKIHLGRAVQIWKLRAFQELGHRAVLIVGDFTAQIGDASDKQAMRRALSEKEVRENMKDYKKQIGKILDMSRVELHYNSEWLNKLTAKELIRLSTKFTAQQLIQRRNFKERWDFDKPIGLHELDYPLLQGYDSVAVKADVEIGGTDQLFNLMMGREIQAIYGQPPQDVMTLKMLNGLDGRKMSTSWGNIIAVVDKAEDMYGKVMSIKDELMPEYFELSAFAPLSEVEEIKAGLKNKKINPRDLKKKLARKITALYHGEKAALAAENEFERIFKEKKVPSNIPAVRVKKKEIPVLDLLVEAKLAGSKAEARRLINQKGVKIDGKVENDWKAVINPKKGMIIQAGKRKFIRLL
jgi:tyrosyl-tRNA synthetase